MFRLCFMTLSVSWSFCRSLSLPSSLLSQILGIYIFNSELLSFSLPLSQILSIYLSNLERQDEINRAHEHIHAYMA